MNAPRFGYLPILLTGFRAALGPIVIFAAYYWPLGIVFSVCLILAFLSDIFDGVIARRLGVATPQIRRLDSVADTVFYASAALAIWHLYPDALRSRSGTLATLIILEFVRYLVDLGRFGREASYHMWTSKLWGLALFSGCFSLLALGMDSVAVDAAILLGIICDLEGLAISFTLRKWRCDVPSIVHAWRIRGQD